MKKLVLIYLFLLSLITIDANTISESKKLSNPFTLAGKNFNYSSPVSEDFILSLCNSEEVFARKNKDYENLFIIQQIVVNSYCLKGDIGLAVDKAHEMYEEAKNIKSDIGIALSIQAMGNTYIYSNQLHQAFSTFNEALNIIEKSNYNFIKTRLLLQQIHTCMLMEDIDNMQFFLARVRNLLDRTEIPNKQDYTFYLQSYQTFYYIVIKDKEQAQISLEDMYQMTRKGHEFNLLYYYLCTRYYELNNEYNQALAYCDSALNISIKSRNLNAFKSIMLEKATLLTKSGNEKQACKVYDSAKVLSDSLNMIRYSKQIDSLHVRYWTDQMSIENAAMHNRFLAWLGGGATLILIIAILLMCKARKKNQIFKNVFSASNGESILLNVNTNENMKEITFKISNSILSADKNQTRDIIMTNEINRLAIISFKGYYQLNVDTQTIIFSFPYHLKH